MACLAPLGRVYQAGTLSGNPVAVAAGLATLDLIAREPPYANLDALGSRLAEGLHRLARSRGLALHCARLGGMFTPFFRAGAPRDLATVKASDGGAYAKLFNGLLQRGLYLPPSPFEVGFISAAHTEAHIDALIARAGEVWEGG